MKEQGTMLFELVNRGVDTTLNMFARVGILNYQFYLRLLRAIPYNRTSPEGCQEHHNMIIHC